MSGPSGVVLVNLEPKLEATAFAQRSGAHATARPPGEREAREGERLDD
jgi:hypothetical protein